MGEDERVEVQPEEVNLRVVEARKNKEAARQAVIDAAKEAKRLEVEAAKRAKVQKACAVVVDLVSAITGGTYPKGAVNRVETILAERGADLAPLFPEPEPKEEVVDKA